MNVFYLDKDPKKSAKALTDVHVNKMLLESAQLLCTAHRVLDGEERKEGRRTVYTLKDKKRDALLYKATHVNHPSAKWVRESQENYYWVYYHMLALCQEFRNRNQKVHETERKLGHALRYFPRNLPRKGFTEPPCVMPENFITDSVVESYKGYYLSEKLKKDKDIERFQRVLG